MNKKQVKRFVKRVSKKNIEVKMIWENQFDMPEFAGYCEWDDIFINRNYWNEISTIDKKMLLLHEIGHIEMPRSKSRVEDEINAQSWAINKAKKLGMKNIHRELIKETKEWKRFNWRSNYRKYILAAKKMKKRGII